MRLSHHSRICPKGVVRAVYAPRIRWQSPCPVVLVGGCSWFVKTVPVGRYALVASVRNGCPVPPCRGRALNGTPRQFLSLSAPCRTRCRAPSLLWPSNTFAVAPAVAPPL